MVDAYAQESHADLKIRRRSPFPTGRLNSCANSRSFTSRRRSLSSKISESTNFLARRRRRHLLAMIIIKFRLINVLEIMINWAGLAQSTPGPK